MNILRMNMDRNRMSCQPNGCAINIWVRKENSAIFKTFHECFNIVFPHNLHSFELILFYVVVNSVYQLRLMF